MEVSTALTPDMLLRERTSERPDHRFLQVAGTWLTHRDLDVASRRSAAVFAQLGVGHQTPVAVMLDNSPPFVHAWWGLARMGALEIPVHTAYRGRLLRHVLAQSRSSVLVVDVAWVDRVIALCDDLPDLDDVVVVGASGGADEVPTIPGCTTHDWDSLMAATAPVDLAAHTEPLDRSVVLYTSGTTGPSKGVVMTHNANFALARSVVDGVGFRPGEVLYTPFPLFHVAARYVSVMAALLVGGSVVVDEKFSASRFWQTCRDEGVTAIHYLGALLSILLKQPPSELDRSHGVRVGYGAGAPTPVAAAMRDRFGLRLHEVYGLTETGVVTMDREGHHRLGSCGREMPGYQVEVVDERDEVVPPGTIGEIVVRSDRPYTMISEYLGMPEATVRAFRNLWFHSGDLGRKDADGFLWFMGRSKDAIRRRGENISAWEVEVALAEHADVQRAAVIGVDDDISGEEVMAVVVLRDAATATPADLVAHCEELLAGFAVPRFIRVVPELPINTSERVKKFELREQGVTADTWDRAATG